MALVTFESVATAADAITKEGGRPSVRAVIAHLGGGSPNQILPHLNGWKAGRPAIRAADFELDPRIAQIIGELIHKAAEQAARTAEERAADISADAEAVAEAGRDAEARATQLETELSEAIEQIASLKRATEDAAAAAEIESKNQQDKIRGLSDQLTIERERADSTAKDLTRAEYRLEQIPKLEAEIQHLAPFEKKTAVLEANLDAANSTLEDLRRRLESAQEQAAQAAQAAATSAREANTARIAEQASQARLESAARELADAKEQAKSAKTDALEAKKYEREALAELKTLRAKVAEIPAPKQ
ncbi:DNA-binding protein [Pseudomonas sp.]|uniref:DNA-binding protein n=1 Tax=Pseudomonas sp. TaxID=306 RepID=UPI0028A2533E|nr:DNA-binding protein [Pseudomonas sp.]